MAKSRGRLLAAVAAAAALAAVPGSAQAAGITGMSDGALANWHPATQRQAQIMEPKINQARLLVRWDVGTLDPNHPDFVHTNRWIAHAVTLRKDILVSFDHLAKRECSREVPFDPNCTQPLPPSPGALRAAILEFRRWWPMVTKFTAWNEPNHNVWGEHWVRGVRQADVNLNPVNSPELAAMYHEQLHDVCVRTGCEAIAGDFADGSGAMGSYPRIYKGYLNDRSIFPRTWAVHPYSASNNLAADPWLDAFFALVGSNVWFTELGVLVCRPLSGGQWAHVDANTQWLAAYHMASVIQLYGVPRAYYHEMQGSRSPGDCGGSVGKWDSGLYGIAGAQPGPRPAMQVLFPETTRTQAESDVDGDGLSDLVTLYSTGAGVTYRGTASGAFAAGQESFGTSMTPALRTGRGWWPIDVADVNGDGYADQVSLHESGSAFVHLGAANAVLGSTWTDNFRWSMTPGINQANGGHEPIAAADVTGDGRADLVTYYAQGRTIVTYSGQVDGRFADGVQSLGDLMDSARFDRSGHYFLDVTDVGGDGHNDLVTLHTNGNAYVFPGLPDGRFGEGIVSFSTTMPPAFDDGNGHEPVAVADVNGDRRSDLLTSWNGWTLVYPGQPNGTFGEVVRSFNGTMPTNLFGSAGHEIIDALDVTGDGKADLITSYYDGGVYVYPGRADGTFGLAVGSFGTTFRSTRFEAQGHQPVTEKPMLRRFGCSVTGCG